MLADGRGASYETAHVHRVYEQIASHFSSTRHKPWPVVERFLTGLPAGAIGLDVGCGNGKYLSVNPDVYIVASDRCIKLSTIAARHQPHSVVVADILDLPHPPAAFDFAICIAVIHHLSTPERRVEATKAVLERLTPTGEALICVWALEQKDSRRGWDRGHEQDVMVPWVLNKSAACQGQTGAAPGISCRIFHRYYHLYQEGELEHDIESAGGRVVAAGYEKDNWWAIMTQGRIVT